MDYHCIKCGSKMYGQECLAGRTTQDGVEDRFEFMLVCDCGEQVEMDELTLQV